MSFSFVNYKGLQVGNTTPAQAGGAAIDNNFRQLADWREAEAALLVPFAEDANGLVPGPTAADIAANRIPRADGTWIDQPAAGVATFLNRSGGGTFTESGAGASVGGLAGTDGSGGTIKATEPANIAIGAANNGGAIIAEGLNFAFARGVAEAGGNIRASNAGAEAMGANQHATNEILSQGFGSFGGGFIPFDGSPITVTGDGSFQWGPGVNGTSYLFQVAAGALGIQFDKDGLNHLIGLFGATPVVQPAHADQAALGAVTTIGTNTGTPGAGLSLIGDTSTTDQSGALMNDLAALREDVAALFTLVGALRTAGVDLGTIKGAA